MNFTDYLSPFSFFSKVQPSWTFDSCLIKRAWYMEFTKLLSGQKCIWCRSGLQTPESGVIIRWQESTPLFSNCGEMRELSKRIKVHVSFFFSFFFLSPARWALLFRKEGVAVTASTAKCKHNTLYCYMWLYIGSESEETCSDLLHTFGLFCTVTLYTECNLISNTVQIFLLNLQCRCFWLKNRRAQADSLSCSCIVANLKCWVMFSFISK